MKNSAVQFRQISSLFKKVFLFIISSLFLCILHAQYGKIDSALISKPIFHFQPEYLFDQPVDAAAWQKVKPGLNASFGSTDMIWFRTEVPVKAEEKHTLTETVWKGERLNAMILIWSPDTISQVRVEVNSLEDGRGNRLDKNTISLSMVRYILSNYPYDARDVSCGLGPVDKAYLMPDKLEAFERFDLPGHTVRPVWLSINIPVNTIAGLYKGHVTVRSENQALSFNLEIKVQNQTLPVPRNWSFRLDLWQNPWVIAEYYKVKPWSSEHKAMLKKHLQLYADAGGKYITTYAVHSPWADNSYMIEGTMIEWIKQKNGSWKFDYSIFDQYVQLAMELGIDKAITIYTPIPWGERFRYVDESTGNYVTERWLPTSDEFKKNWNVFLTNLQKHLEAKGWFNKTYLGINENAMEQTLSAIHVIKAHSKKWKITYAGDWHPELDNLLDDYSCVYGKEAAQSDVVKRSSKGQMSTYYICCTPAKPNTFIFSPPVEARWLGWYAFAYGYDGLLRWAYDAWPADPVRDARHLLWPAGDCFMVYPGANSSIRFEKMREGIVDYEKIKRLLSMAAKSSNNKVKSLAEALRQHLQVFVKEREFKEDKLQDAIREGRKIVEELSDRLIQQK